MPAGASSACSGWFDDGTGLGPCHGRSPSACPCRASCCGFVLLAEGSIKPCLTSGLGLQGLWAWVLREAWPSPSAWPSLTYRRWLQPFTASLVWLRCVLLLPSVGCDSRCLASCDQAQARCQRHHFHACLNRFAGVCACSQLGQSSQPRGHVQRLRASLSHPKPEKAAAPSGSKQTSPLTCSHVPDRSPTPSVSGSSHPESWPVLAKAPVLMHPLCR